MIKVKGSSFKQKIYPKADTKEFKNLSKIYQFFKNYYPVRVRLWLVYKITENNLLFATFRDFIQKSKEVSYLRRQTSILT